MSSILKGFHGLSRQCMPATKSSEPRLQSDPNAEFDFLRIVALSTLACAARRVKFFQKALDALAEATNSFKSISFKSLKSVIVAF